MAIELSILHHQPPGWFHGLDQDERAQLIGWGLLRAEGHGIETSLLPLRAADIPILAARVLGGSKETALRNKLRGLLNDL